MEAKIQLQVKDIEPVKSLLKLLEDNFEGLPKAVQDGLRAISEPNIEWLTIDDYHDKAKNIEGEFATSFQDAPIVKVSIDSKKIVILGFGNKEKIIDLEHFWIKKGETIIWEW